MPKVGGRGASVSGPNFRALNRELRDLWASFGSGVNSLEKARIAPTTRITSNAVSNALATGLPTSSGKLLPGASAEALGKTAGPLSVVVGRGTFSAGTCWPSTPVGLSQVGVARSRGRKPLSVSSDQAEPPILLGSEPKDVPSGRVKPEPAVGPRMLRPETVVQLTAAQKAFGLAATLVEAGGPTQMRAQSRTVLFVAMFRLVPSAMLPMLDMESAKPVPLDVSGMTAWSNVVTVTSGSKKDMPPVTVTGEMPLRELAESPRLSSLESTGTAELVRPETLTLVADSGASTTNPPMWGSEAADVVVLPRPKAPKATRSAATIAATPTFDLIRTSVFPSTIPHHVGSNPIRIQSYFDCAPF